MQRYLTHAILFLALSSIYLLGTALIFPDNYSNQTIVAASASAGIFLLSSLITSTYKTYDAQKNAQRFLIATTIQLLSALFFVLIYRLTEPDHFKRMALQFAILFFVFLLVQAMLLIVSIRKSENTK